MVVTLYQAFVDTALAFATYQDSGVSTFLLNTYYCYHLSDTRLQPQARTHARGGCLLCCAVLCVVRELHVEIWR